MSGGNWLDDSIEGLLLDVSGVLKNGDNVIEGSLEAMEMLKSMNIPFRLVTNETQVSTRRLHEQLTKFGYDIPSNHIVSPAPLIAKHLKENNLRPHLLVHPNVLEDFAETITSDPNCFVIGDAAEHFSYKALNGGFQFLMHDKTRKFYSMGKGKFYKENDKLMIDVGAYTAALEFSTGLTADIFGKPSVLFFQHALKDLGLNSNQVVMIGDDIVGDIGGAQLAGIRSVLVQTGKYQEGDESRHQYIPNAIVPNLKAAILHIRTKNQRSPC